MRKFDVTGMSCAACSARVEKAVSKLEGVTSCSVNLLTNTMLVDGAATDSEIISAVENAGYGAKNISDKKAAVPKSSKDDETKKLVLRLVSSVIFLAVLMYFSMGYVMWGFPLPKFFEGNHLAVGLIQLVLTVIVMIINGKFFTNGFKSLFRGTPNMDSLVALGASASFGYSLYMLFAMTGYVTAGDMESAHHCLHEFYFESAAMILALITVGKTLESHAKGKTTNALKSLMELAPKTASVLRDGKETVIPAEELRVGDIIAVRPGESIPADGIVLSGESAVNESALTGESLPIDKSEGSSVSAGTINQSGFLKCEVTKTGEETALAKIIQMVSDATAAKAPAAKAADKVAGVFVPAVIAIAVITLFVWLLLGKDIGFAIARSVSVLVISCPCALGLATPVAIMVGSGIGAKNKILFKTAETLEETGKVSTVILDKTGTITKGTPEVTDIVPLGNIGKQEFLTIAASLEAKSQHPLAKAVINKAEELGTEFLEADEFATVTGLGLTAVIGGIHVYGGNEKYVSSYAEIPAEAKAASEDFAEHGKTPLFFAANGKLIGIIAVADVIKEDSAAAIKRLHDMGLYVVMLTGDNAKTAEAIGKAAGVDQVIAGVLPDGKESVVRSFKSHGKTAMVGDGINDAPALTSADVGIAIGAGTDIAIDAAGVVLMQSKLSDVASAIALSRATLRNIYENLFWAFIYNTAGIPLAAGVFISLLGWEMNPMFGAAAMSLSSFCVVMNALRLNFANIRNRNYKIIFKHQVKEIKPMEKTMKIEGMMCMHCSGRVKKTLESIDGVISADVSHEKGTAIIQLSKDVADGLLKEKVEAEGYKVL